MSSFFFFLGVQFCNIAKNGDHPQEDLARFGYKLHMKVNFFKNILFWVRGKGATYLNHVKGIWRFLNRFWSIFGYSTSQKNTLFLAYF